MQAKPEHAKTDTPQPATIAQVAVPRPLHGVYDYKIPHNTAGPSIGARVRVPFGRAMTIGICTGLAQESAHKKLKDIVEVIDTQTMVPDDLMHLAHWMTGYYHHPLGEVLATLLPAAARKGAVAQIAPGDWWCVARDEFTNPRAPAQQALFDYLKTHGPCRGKDLVAQNFKRSTLRNLARAGAVETWQSDNPIKTPTPDNVPTPAQENAINAIVASLGQFAVHLLDGVTGSGKTEVYLQAMAPVLAQGQQVLVLVPEIALTPQTVRRFEERYGRVGVLHSNLSDHERLQTWLKAKSGTLPVVIGTRSAIFTPFNNLGLIVVDEEHDSSYKQQDGLRYSARDLAAKRAQHLNLPVILGSATPSLESIYNVNRNRYRHLLLPHRAGGARMPSYHLVDMRGESQTDGLSVPLQHIIRQHLRAAGQVLLFINRRGYAPTLLCKACGWQAQCSECDAKMTYHTTPSALRCHHCGLRVPVPQTCGQCGQPSLMPVGMGTQRTEAGLARLFPDVPIYRIDRDSTRSNKQLVQQFDKINTGATALMVGTQMLAKGHHFPNVTLVAILNADAGFCSPDFRAPERTAQLITQVAGRAGRAERPGEVWIQSYQPENPVLTRLIESGYAGFAELELKQRIQAGLPPAKPMALIRAEATNPSAATTLLNEFKRQLAVFTELELLGPVPAPLARVANRSRHQLMLVAPSRPKLHQGLAHLSPPKQARQIRWSIDVDPYDSL